jgi:Domain of unknown function (DUF4157)
MTATHRQMKNNSAPATMPKASGVLQRRCACNVHTSGGGECAACSKKKNSLQRKLTIGASNDPLELEADRVADLVMATPANPTVSDVVPRIQRYTARAKGAETAPASVERALASSGRPLEPALQQDMEQRFGHDFSRVRVHSNAAAERSALDVNAQAYTVGHNIVFGTGQFQPHTPNGQRLLAHELTHVVQQGERVVAGALLQRACLSAAECATPSATLTGFVADTESKPENISKADKRKKVCSPPTAACTSDGHGAKASALTALVTANYPSRLGFITGIFVNKDMPATWGAVTMECSSFMPPLPGAKCTFVPDRLEAQAKLYQSGNMTIGGSSRAEWLTSTLGTLTHETEHARFDAAAPIAKPTATACKFEDHESNLSEMAAHLSEMHVFYRDALARPAKDRFKQFYQMFDFWVKNGSEDISGIVKDLRCKCECSDADYYITKTSESVSSNQKWDTNELFMIHSELRNPKWGFKPQWPVVPPSVNVPDLPTVAAVPFKLPA